MPDAEFATLASTPNTKERIVSLTWHKDIPVWDAGKLRIVGGTEKGILDSRYADIEEGSAVPCNWYRAERDGAVVGYGWVDVNWGEAEILLATSDGAQGSGVGSFILEQLDDEARRMGLAYIYNVVRPTHPQGDKVAAWLAKRGFEKNPDGRLTRQVGKALTS
ncbi:MAG: GNAT family N-acetyltransferase [Kofleriaceae bacterium]|nr:GNAT family N-acetyltransferase [Kofleriaceae bacterium]